MLVLVNPSRVRSGYAKLGHVRPGLARLGQVSSGCQFNLVYDWLVHFVSG